MKFELVTKSLLLLLTFLIIVVFIKSEIDFAPLVKRFNVHGILDYTEITAFISPSPGFVTKPFLSTYWEENKNHLLIAMDYEHLNRSARATCKVTDAILNEVICTDTIHMVKRDNEKLGGRISSYPSTSTKNCSVSTINMYCSRFVNSRLVDSKLSPSSAKWLIVVTSCNHIEMTIQCMKYLSKAIHASKFPPDVIIVDDNSIDGSPDVLRALGYAVIETGSAKGVTYAWNLGYKFALQQNYEHIIFANNDLLVPIGALDELYLDLNRYAVVVPVTSLRGAGHNPLQAVTEVHNLPATVEDYLNHPWNMQSVQDGLLSKKLSGKRVRPLASAVLKKRRYRPKFNGFFFGLNMTTSKLLCGEDEELFNTSNIMVGQEDALAVVLEQHGIFPMISPFAFIFHYKSFTVKKANESRVSAGVDQRENLDYYHPELKTVSDLAINVDSVSALPLFDLYRPSGSSTSSVSTLLDLEYSVLVVCKEEYCSYVNLMSKYLQRLQRDYSSMKVRVVSELTLDASYAFHMVIGLDPFANYHYLDLSDLSPLILLVQKGDMWLWTHQFGLRNMFVVIIGDPYNKSNSIVTVSSKCDLHCPRPLSLVHPARNRRLAMLHIPSTDLRGIGFGVTMLRMVNHHPLIIPFSPFTVRSRFAQLANTQICMGIRTFSNQLHWLKSLLHQLISQYETIELSLRSEYSFKVFIVDTEPSVSSHNALKDLVDEVSNRSQSRIVSYLYNNVVIDEQTGKNSYFGYDSTDGLLRYLMSSAEYRCDWLMFTNGDNMYSNIWLQSVINSMESNSNLGLIGWDFVTHHPRRSVETGLMLPLQPVSVKLRRGYVDLGSIMARKKLMDGFLFMADGLFTTDLMARDYALVQYVIKKLETCEKCNEEHLIHEVLLLHQ